MRLHRLELTGFGPFRERQVVDFDAFADDGIFLISGRTGSGKSSVLDGVCFALYGGVPRYDGVEKRLRSDYCAPDEPTSVMVEFTAGGRRWRVTRSPEYDRPKQRGTGMTTEPHRAELDELIDGQWIGRAARPVDVARDLDEILGLNQQQFLQVILLAQNRFAEFLHAKNDERQRLLRRLFGTRTYEDYQTALEQRRKDAERDLAVAGDGVALLLDESDRLIAAHDLAGEGAPPAGSEAGRNGAMDFPARLAGAAVGVQRAAYRVETRMRDRDAADAAHRDAEAFHAAARALRAQQELRMRSRAALAALEVRASRIDADRAVLARAVAAEALRAPIEAAERAAAEATAADDALSRTRLAWAATPDSVELPEPDAAALADMIEQLTGDLAVWGAAALRERDLVRAEAVLAEDRARVVECERVLAELDELRAAFPARLEALDADLAAARDAAGAREVAGAQLAAAAGRLTAAREASRLEGHARKAEAAYLSASGDHDRTRAAVTALLQRRLAGHAGELAAALVDGEPCAVCGATEHPLPAPSTSEPVSDGDIAAAESARDAAAAVEATASGEARVAREAYAAAAARAGGEREDVLVFVHAQAESAFSAAMDAEARRDSLAAERQGLVQIEAEALTERERLVAELGTVRERVAAGASDVESTRRAVDEARGGFESVQARMIDATERRALAVSLADALAALAGAAGAARRAMTDRDARIAASDFEEAADATAALLDAPARAELDRRIRDHEGALRAERDRLRDLELELAGEPDELVDVEAAAARHADARERWSTAVDAAANARETATRLADLVARAERAHSSIAGLADDHAVVARLANTVAGRAPNTHRMTLESFVLAAELEEIVEAANLRLEDMSSGRYRLQHTDALAARGAASGLGLQIMDAHTGQARPAQSLSGGETFLASLSLALGLAEVVTARAGGVRLDTLFIDEGFGSLDDDTLDLAMRTLDELRQGGRTVGLISHVAAMKEQLPAQLLVEATPHGPSVILQEAVVPA
ncbi:SMC family ATPase [Microbacterium pumilum]|uniref:Nuclease SbcCD subunit C n=1 Tax=Microbacterium pumilum TaxID=344165 RepID=A0ABP5EG09_9MICO